MVCVHLGAEAVPCGESAGGKLAVRLRCAAFGGGDDPAEIFFRHGDGAVDQIAQIVREIGVVPTDDRLVGYRSVVVVGHFREGIVAHAVHGEALCEVIGVDHVAAGLGHFVRTEIEPGVTDYGFRKLKTERHEEDRPVYRVETDDVLSDDVEIGGPVLFEQLRLFPVFRIVADGGDIV